MLPVVRDAVPIPHRCWQPRTHQQNHSNGSDGSGSGSSAPTNDHTHAPASAPISPSHTHAHTHAHSTPLSASSSSASTSSLATAVDARSSSMAAAAAAAAARPLPLPHLPPALIKFEPDHHPSPMPLCTDLSVQRGALLAVHTQGKNNAQLYTVDAVGKRGVWGRTLQSGDDSRPIYLPLGLPTHNSRKQADILLVTPVTTRKDDERGVYFSLQPLTTRESTDGLVESDIFFDEDGLYRGAVVAESSQEPEDLLLRKDRRPWVDILDSSSKDANKILHRCRLPDDVQTVHLHGQPHLCVTIPTIITVSPIDGETFKLWMLQADAGGFLRMEDVLEHAQAQECERRSVSSRSAKGSDTLHQPLDLNNVLNGLFARIMQEPAAVDLLLPEQQHEHEGEGEGDHDTPTTLRQVQQKLSEGAYNMDPSLLSAAKAARHGAHAAEALRERIVAPVMSMLEHMAHVWRVLQSTYSHSSSPEHKLCRRFETIWSDECRKQGGLLKELEEQRKQLVRVSKESSKRSSVAPSSAASAAASVAAAAEAEVVEMEEEKSEASNVRMRGAGAGSGAAAAAASAPMASHDRMAAILHQALHLNQQRCDEMQAQKAELVRLRKELDDERRTNKLHADEMSALRLQHQLAISSLQSDASANASAPLVAELEHARATIAARDASIVEQQRELSQLRVSAADLERVRQECAIDVVRERKKREAAESENEELLKEVLVSRQRQADEVAQRLKAKAAAAAAGHKHARSINLIDDDEPPAARQRIQLEQQSQEQKERES